ncbi:MAG: hypothetical protein QOJ51_1531 [Acidobacteriaceae bacterium]|jgi:hypothetical protein|nr:hypothetical protein [Acidobacteriaceae bacterium]
MRLSSFSRLGSESFRGRWNVETFAEILSAIAAVVLTVACGLLLEELLFGGLVRLFVAPRPGAREKPSPKREEAREEEEQEEKEEHTCLP